MLPEFFYSINFRILPPCYASAEMIKALYYDLVCIKFLAMWSEKMRLAIYLREG